MGDDLDRLEERIKQARQHGDETDAVNPQEAENMNTGLRAGAELIGSIGGGAFIGWLLDRWLETAPVFLIILLLMGIAAGFYNVYRISSNMGTAVGFSQLHRWKTDAKNAPDNGNHKTRR